MTMNDELFRYGPQRHPPWWRRLLVWLLGRRIEIANERGTTVYREWRGVTYLWSYRDERNDDAGDD